jgi:hypothetical protein
MITIACVYRSGPKFSSDYVDRLYNMISRNTSASFKFICLTDVQSDVQHSTIELQYNLKRWWSKIELFRPNIFNTSHVLYFDLDTLILDNIDEIIEVAGQNNFMMLRGFNQKNLLKGDCPASGIMSFKTDSKIPRYIFDQFMINPHENIKRTKKQGGSGGQGGDQGFIGSILGWDNIDKFQDKLPKNYIMGKRFIKNYKDSPPPCNIVAWSGNPELKDAIEQFKWMRKVWK